MGRTEYREKGWFQGGGRSIFRASEATGAFLPCDKEATEEEGHRERVVGDRVSHDRVRASSFAGATTLVTPDIVFT